MSASLLTWLDAHAPAVQALASVAALIVTAVLAILTGRYVHLTKSIAQSSADQIAHEKEVSITTRRQAAAALQALCRRLRVPLEGLAKEKLQHERLLDYSQLVPDDIPALEGLAQQVSPEASNLAGKAAVSLRRIQRLIDHARGINRLTGWNPSEIHQKEWSEASDAGPKMLAAVEKVCQDIIAT